jgi:hypothetical protein
LRRASAVIHLKKYTNDYLIAHVFFVVKGWIQKNWCHVQAAEYPEVALLESSAVVTVEKSRGWFVHSGYVV